MAVQEVGEVGPSVGRLRGRHVSVRVQQVAPARHGVLGVHASGRPRRDHEQVSGQAPAVIRLEHVVLKDVVPGVGPVVRDLPGVVVAHGVHPGPLDRDRARGELRVRHARPRSPMHRLADEPVHPAAVDVSEGVLGGVRPPAVLVVRVVPWPDAPPAERIEGADRWRSVPHGDAVRSRERAEVGIEGTVFLHDDDDVPDLLDPSGQSRPDRPGGFRRHDPFAAPTRGAAHAEHKDRGADRQDGTDANRASDGATTAPPAASLACHTTVHSPGPQGRMWQFRR